MIPAEKQAEERKIKEKQRLLSYDKVFTSEAGKIVLEDLAKECGINISTIRNREAIDPLSVVFYEGKRDVYMAVSNTIAKAKKERK